MVDMNQKMVIGAVVIAVVAFSLGRFTGPKKVEVKEVQKTVYVEKEQREREQNVTETEKETRFPDGTVVREKTKTKETQSKTKTSTEARETKVSERSIESRPSWRIGIAYEVSIESGREVHYSLILERQLLGEIYLGGIIGTDKSAGLVLSLGF
jgi:hypothetical protein